MRRMRVLIVVLFALLAFPAFAERLAVGDAAPSLRAPGVEEAVEREDDATTRPMVLVFLKPGDMHAGDAIEALAAINARHERFAKETRTFVIFSRLNDGEKPAVPEQPKDWRVLFDRCDALYHAYGIIATPTVVVVGNDGRVAGFHPGYSSGLAQAVARDVVVALDGEEALNKPTPTPGIMKLQMGRALARRGLWEKALGYYEQAASEQELPREAMVEMAGIHLELGEAGKTLGILDEMGDSVPDLEEVEKLRARARALLDGKARPPKPPSVP
ncbi:MAG: Redoxin [Candidatus Sumerlaeota bacterium]|nr:Redoxin [Candidatus Sumerlaeota bacterium]